MEKAIKFNQGKALARYFYWEGLAVLEKTGCRRCRLLHIEVVDELIKELQAGDIKTALKSLTLLEYDIVVNTDLKDIGDGVTRASTTGAQKYGHYNYQQPFKYTEIVDALGRHMLSYLYGDVTDKESGLDHRYHMLANIYMLAYHLEHPEIGINDFVQDNEEERNENQ